MKKIISIMLAAALALGSIGTSAFADAAKTPVTDYGYFETFDGAADGFTSTVTTSAIVSQGVDNEDEMHEKFLSIEVPTDAASYCNNTLAAAVARQNGENLEIEFDIKTKQFAANSISRTEFRFHSEKGYFRLYFTNGKIHQYNSNGKSIGEVGKNPTGIVGGLSGVNDTGWHRYKFVFKPATYTAGSGDAAFTANGLEIENIYVDGLAADMSVSEGKGYEFADNILTNPRLWANIDKNSTISAGDIGGFTKFQFCPNSKGNSSYFIEIDNLSVITYDAATEAAPERYPLYEALSSAYDIYNAEDKASFVNEKAVLLAEINKAKAVMNNAGSAQTVLDGAISDLAAAVSEFNEATKLVTTAYTYFDSFEALNAVPSEFTIQQASSEAKQGTLVFVDEGATFSNQLHKKYIKYNFEQGQYSYNNNLTFTTAIPWQENGRTEIAADFKLEGIGDGTTNWKYCDLRFTAGSTYRLMLEPNGEIYFANNGGGRMGGMLGKSAAVSNLFKESGWHHMKLVFDDIIYSTDTLTDRKGKKLVQFDIDGESVITPLDSNETKEYTLTFKDKTDTTSIEYSNPFIWPYISYKSSTTETSLSDKHLGDFNKINFFGNGNSELTHSVSLDNVSVIGYNQEANAALNREALVCELKAAEALYSTYKTEAGFAEAAAALLTQIEAANTVYETKVTTQAEINTAEANLKAATAAFEDSFVKVLFDSNETPINGTPASDSSFGIAGAVELAQGTTETMEFEAIPVNEAALDLYVATDFEVKVSGFEGNADAALSVNMLGKDGIVHNTMKLKGGADAGINLVVGSSDKYYSELKDDKWYTIRLVTRLTNDAKENYNRNIKYYIDGNTLIVINTDDLTNADGDKGRLILHADTAEYINKLSFDVTGGSAVVDNVKVTKYYGGQREPVNYGQLLTSIRRGDAKVNKAVVGKNVTQTILDTYTTALANAKAVYNEKADQRATELANDELCTAYSKFLFANEATELGKVYFADSNNADAAYITDGGYVTRVSLTKRAEYDYAGTLLVAVYQNGSLYEVKMVENVLAGKPVGSLEVDIPDIKLPASKAGVTVKAMLLDGLDSLKPIAKALEPQDAAVDVYVMGDSLVQTYNNTNDTADDYAYPRQGWGAYVENYFNDGAVNVTNLAVSGHTTRTSVETGKFKQMQSEIGEGDYLLVSFMTNDASVGSIRRVADMDYKNMLRLYADAAEEKGAKIVFVTSTPYLNNKGDYGAQDGGVRNGYYPELMKAVAAEYNAPVVDLYTKRIALQRTLDADYAAQGLSGYDVLSCTMYYANTQALYKNFGKGTGTNISQKNYLHNGEDATHYTQWGANQCASWIAESMAELDCGLAYRVNGNVWTTPQTAEIIPMS